ncbi:DUF6171 family protein [Terrabacter sp. MAHUQ-38]|jgi:hypothetical protein|uniref:DUF6171 family protein n=1 Tax=unclassified Terrabacter TaxID=2630222 RepID=UPI001CAA6E47
MTSGAAGGNRPCRRCPSAEDRSPEAVRAAVREQLSWETDLASEEVRDRRLDLCRRCPDLLAHTCRRCGCYVEFRASLQDKKCPRGSW